jgi:hypothetical protein
MRACYVDAFWDSVEEYSRIHGALIPIAAIADEMGISHDGVRRIAEYLEDRRLCLTSGNYLKLTELGIEELARRREREAEWSIHS